MSMIKRTISALLVCVMLFGMMPPVFASAEETEPAVAVVSVTEPSETALEEETEAPAEETTEATTEATEDPAEETTEATTEATEAPVEETTEETEPPQQETEPTVPTETVVTQEAAEAATELVFNSSDLVKLEIQTLPAKVWYQAGDAVDLTGIVLYAEDSQGLSATVDAEDVSIVSGDASAAGRHMITVAYGNLTASFEILVHNQIVSGEVLQDSKDYPESAHNYANYSDVSYTYTCEGAEYLKLTFSSSTYVENNYDKIYLYDGADTLLGTYTAGNLAGVTVTVNGDTVRIRLTSDSSYNYYGFSLDSIYAKVEIAVHEPVDEGVYTDPLCFENGYTTHTCWICDETFIEEDLDSAAHSFSDGFCAVCGLPENQVSSGLISETIAWAVTDENILYVSGVGEIPDNVSWPSDVSAVTSVIVGEGITHIGTKAFYSKSNLESITLPDSLESIGSNAFQSCSKLTSLYIPAGVADISASSYSYSPFYGCSSSLVLYCEAAEKQSGWDSYWNYRATGSALSTNYGYSRGEYAYWSSIDNSVESIVIPDGITAIPNRAFYNCKALISVTLPEGLTSIGEYAFYGCTGLTEIVIPEDVVTIGGYAFYNCTGLKDVTLPDSLTVINNCTFYNCEQMTLDALPASLTQIGVEAFVNCKALTGIVFPETLTAIGSYAFRNCIGLTDVSFHDGLVSISNGAFYQCSNLTSVALPETLTNLGDSAFYGCAKLTELYLPGSITTVTYNGESGPLNGSGVTKVIFGDGFTAIPEFMLSSSNSSGSYASKITEVVFEAPEKITSIGRYAFYNCVALESLTLPENVTSLPDYALGDCKRLTSITLPGNLTDIGYYSFGGCIALTEISLPASVTGIENYAFQNCSGLTAITLPNGLKTVGCSMFYGCTSLTELYLPASITTMYYSNNRGPLDGSSITKVTFGDGFTSIPAYALSNYASGTGNAYSSHIREVVFEAPEKITSIGSYAFRNCSALESIEIPENVASIPTYAFYGCHSLAEVKWSHNLTSIGSYAFQNCVSLQSVILPDTLRNIGSYSFQNCSSVKEVELPAGTSVGTYAFKDCTALTDLTVGDHVSIGSYAFNSCSGLRTISMGENVTIASDAFYNVVISDTCGDAMSWTLDLGTGTFTLKGSGEMTDYSPENPAPWHAFASMIEKIEIANTVSDIGAYAFADCTKLEGMILPDNIKTISECSFSGSTNLCYLELPDGIQRVGENAFDGCDALEEVVFLGDAPVMEDNCFGTSDAKVYYPETASGFIARIFEKFIQYIWKKWDDTIPSKDVVILLDTSGSMSGKTATLSSASSQLIKSIGGAIRKTNISIVEYDSSAVTLAGFSTNTYYLTDVVASLEASGNTNYSSALNRANSLLSGRDTDIKFVIMFSDGQPGDSTSTINSIAQSMRDKGIVIYTVGLGTNSSQRQVLINVAGDASRYFEASNIAGLIAAFQELSENFGKSEYSTVEMKINDARHDLLSDPYALCLASDITISFYLTPGTNDLYDNVASIALEQDGRYVLQNESGIFENIRPGDYFQAGKPVYMVMIDSDGNVVERKEILLSFSDSYTITYVMGPELENSVYLEVDFIPGSDIVKPDDPSRLGYKFVGWYASEDCNGAEFFSNLNYYNRLTLEDNLTLYAKWQEDISTLTMGLDSWNWINYSVGRYPITDSDYTALINGIDPTDEDDVTAYRNRGGAFCFGMSSSAVLANDNTIEVNDFDARYDTVYDANRSSAPIMSMISYYHLRQLAGSISRIRNGYNRSNESVNVRSVVNKLLTTGEPVVMGFTFDSISGGHAVVVYDIRETGNGYEFQAYDCSLETDNSFTVQVTVDENDNYVLSSPEWEARWGSGFFIKYGLTSAELQQMPILVAPNRTLGTASARNAVSNYELVTSYDSFTISNGTDFAVIEDGQVVSGNLTVDCYGYINEVDSAPQLMFVLPLIGEDAFYTITQNTAGALTTSLKYGDSAVGFKSTVESQVPGTIKIGADGRVITQFAEAVNHSVRITQNDTSTPWYKVEISGASEGFTLLPAEDTISVTSATETVISVEAFSGINNICLTDVPAGAEAIEITDNEDGDCVVVQDNQVIASGRYGYSVVFDSKYGTTVESLVNVPYGSLIEEPIDPTKTGYIFQGWFKDAEYTEIWDFDTDTVTQDTVLHAGWSINPNYLQSVTFRIPGQEDQIVYIPKGDLIPSDYAPLGNDGEELIWYTNAAYTSEAWDFAADAVTGDLVLYGKTTLCTVSYVTNCSQTLAASKLYEGMNIPEPAGLTRDGYTLCGWYTDEALTNAWDFAKDTLAESITLYAKWLANEFDQENNDTGICIEILQEDSYVYTGKAVLPTVVVRDGGKVLTAGTDYTVSYKNNTVACDKDDASVKASKLPQIIVQGKGNYKSAKKITKYFTIHQADMKDLQVTLPGFLAAKAGDKLQTVKAAVSTGLAKVADSNYTIRYYTDEELTEEVKGITAAGRYYVTLEAKAGKNITGVTDAFAIDVTSAALMVSSAKITAPKSITAVAEQPQENTAIQALISKVILNKVTYLTDADNIEAFKELFVLTAKDTDGTEVSQSDLGSILMTVGKKTVTIAAKEGNAEGFLGEKSFTVTVKGTALNKKQFQVTFDKTGATTTTNSQYSGVSQTPTVISDLELNTDYTVTYKSGKQNLTALQVKNAGSYTLVITGKGAYSGSLSYSFTITKADIAQAYQNGALTIRHSGEAVYDPAGAKLVPSVSYVNAKGTRMALGEGTDYTISYSGNKAITEKAAMTLKGKGNYTGTLSKVSELTYSVVQKPIDAGDITVTVTGLTLKNGEVTGVKHTIYHSGKKVAADQYTNALTDNDDGTMTLKILAKEKLYTGTRSLIVRRDLIKTTDTKQVKIALPKENRYYSGSAIQPKPVITDADGYDISDCFTVTYGTNTQVGIGTVTITGCSDKGYYGSTTLKFTILPRWAKWIFG